MGAEDVGDLGRYGILLRGHPLWDTVPPGPDDADVVEEGIDDEDRKIVVEYSHDVQFGPTEAVQEGPPHVRSTPMRDAGDDVHVGGLLANAGFLDHVHGRGTGADDDDVGLGDFAGPADIVVVFDWEGRRLLTW